MEVIKRLFTSIAALVRRSISCLDHAQESRAPLSIAVAVVKKMGEDRSGELSAAVAFYSFFSIFPLLLVFGTLSGIAFDAYPDLRAQAVDVVVRQFPRSPELRNLVIGIRGSPFALFGGMIGAMWGALGAVSVLRASFDRTWAVPIRERIGQPKATVQNLSVLLQVGLGLGAALVTGSLGQFWSPFPWGREFGGLVMSTAFGVASFAAMFRSLSPQGLGWRALLPGLLLSTAAWLTLQAIGSKLVAQQIGNQNSATGVFTSGLVLISWLALMAKLVIVGNELNAVLCRGWWPRSIASPGESISDRRTLRAHAQVEERVDSERVVVMFEPDK